MVLSNLNACVITQMGIFVDAGWWVVMGNFFGASWQVNGISG